MPPTTGMAAPIVPPPDAVAKFEKDMIQDALKSTRGNRAKAARLLSLVTMIFSIGPAVAPILGGWIVKLSDWRTIFLFLFGYTYVVVKSVV